MPIKKSRFRLEPSAKTIEPAQNAKIFYKRLNEIINEHYFRKEQLVTVK